MAMAKRETENLSDFEVADDDDENVQGKPFTNEKYEWMKWIWTHKFYARHAFICFYFYF